MDVLTLTARGSFSLAAGARFLEGFAPAGRTPAACWRAGSTAGGCAR